ncbi:MAG TPA: diaminopimelate epimerase [Syntrophorhabdaceae bacterium]|nr:diaminopimelate epimerase [Syntrophorhabdaceae bacterium]HOT42713.1 diaminopimelate epimerase [Syntrophorhabdaceae bacterium]HPC66828.1 diaminopimelate epimerase [Syntrophorhabdaceae bacterium]HQE79356.1 diaminopimelate epimerase [Syntrophorhabdaceae bacterium]HQH43009.1 diaminopimelate epimerase [Syntrophorhabdaceae bacterium]
MFEIEFYKLNASGNDFILIDNRDGIIYKKYSDIKDFVVKICRQHHSVGADGVIFIEDSDRADFRWRFFNSDGSEAEMCGNGGRCAARYAYIKGIAKSNMVFETQAGLIKAEVESSKVKLQLTNPVDLKLDYPIKLEDRELFISSVNTGVPHAVLITDDVEYAPVEELGRKIRFHSAFGNQGSNVNFVQIIDQENVKIRTYERGVEGETLACGTGAVATGVILKEKGLVKTPVKIWTRGGEKINIYIDNDVYLEGESRIVFKGELNREALL